jgi:hypothetical protein
MAYLTLIIADAGLREAVGKVRSPGIDPDPDLNNHAILNNSSYGSS